MTYAHIVTVVPKEGMSASNVEAALEGTIDWYRYQTGCYIVISSGDAKALHKALKPIVDPGGKLFICRLDLADRQGWMIDKFWKWLRSHS